MHRKIFVAGLAFGLSFIIPVQASSPIPDSAYEDEILYRTDHSVTLYTDGNKPLRADSDPSLALLVKNGTGFLVDIPLLQQGPDGRPLATGNIEAQLNNHRGWIKLTPEKCKQQWGAPQKRARPIQMFCFDVIGIGGNEEKNLYHVDLNFAKTGNAVNYRIRGIGISDPKWVRHDLDNDTIQSSR